MQNCNAGKITKNNQEGFLTDIGIRVLNNKLTTKEFECLKLIAKGKTAKETARIMNISNRTIDTHILNMRQKLNCISKSQLANVFWSTNLHLL